MSAPKLVEAKDWNAILTRLEVLEALTHVSLSDDDPIKGSITSYEGIGTESSRDDHVHPNLPRDPDYDSQWFALAQDANVNKPHGTGSTELLIIMQGKTSGDDIHEFYAGWSAGGIGAWWMTLTTTNINVNRGISDTKFVSIRVFAWQLDLV